MCFVNTFQPKATRKDTQQVHDCISGKIGSVFPVRITTVGKSRILEHSEAPLWCWDLYLMSANQVKMPTLSGSLPGSSPAITQ
jgi:hypothetical protein